MPYRLANAVPAKWIVTALRATRQDVPHRVARRLLPRIAAVALCLGLAACTTSGRPFDTQGLNALVPGATTLAQATQALGTQPVDVYRAVDGSLVARWAQKYTWVPDAMYWRKEVWLAFDAYGRFTHQVENINAHPLPEDDKGTEQVGQPQSNAAVSSAAQQEVPGPLGSLPAPQSADGNAVSYPVHSSKR